MVMVGCCSNVVFLELLIKYDQGAGNLVTFGQFLFIAVEGFIFALDFGRKKPVIPIKQYMILVAFFFTVSVTNNYCFYFDIPMPLHMIFRAPLKKILLGSKRQALLPLHIKNKLLYTFGLLEYKFSKYISIFMISAGIFLCTLLSAQDVNTSGTDEDDTSVSYKYLTWATGLGLLMFALFLSARMGIYQEVLYSKYGKHPREALFFSHALPLVGFLFVGKDIVHHGAILSQSAPVTVYGDITIPVMWAYLLGNVITQYVCIRGVFILPRSAPLVVTLVVTLRKFVSLVFSIWFFQNPFTVGHWCGTFLVFSGVLLFTETLQKARTVIFGQTKDVKKVD
ncbi:putative UDP-xylose and UDP-N-acetylglucosamine transporter-like [Apostichopus japonicus]|uniref:Putative UDP-xylose and UDP-N-acetylglucosamine transporter-like n=1 Tax=Stichopus japonicus TaxID=307972 RepID=A0A2G8JMN1_STIJA|nr:putative UDP-xylose and UDP-N-acetylglucosamine transporter-like [Apostichopus japonicus]